MVTDVVALKKLELPSGASQAALERTLGDFLSEAKMLQRVGHHPCIVSMLGTTELPLAMIMEFCPHGNLMDKLDDEDVNFDWPLKRRIALQVTCTHQPTTAPPSSPPSSSLDLFLAHTPLWL